MTKKQLFTSINNLCKELDNKYNINCGGCCFVAAVIAEQLEKHNIFYTLIHYDKYSCHYAIRVNDRILNRCDYNFREIVLEEHVPSDTIFSNYYSEDWNKMYNKKWNLIVKTKIKSIFRKYENSRT